MRRVLWLKTCHTCAVWGRRLFGEPLDKFIKDVTEGTPRPQEPQIAEHLNPLPDFIFKTEVQSSIEYKAWPTKSSPQSSSLFFCLSFSGSHIAQAFKGVQNPVLISTTSPRPSLKSTQKCAECADPPRGKSSCQMLHQTGSWEGTPFCGQYQSPSPGSSSYSEF